MAAVLRRGISSNPRGCRITAAPNSTYGTIVGARSSGRKEVGNSPYSLRITTIRPEESLPRERSECPGCRAPTQIRSGQNQIETALVEFKWLRDCFATLGRPREL